MYVHFCLYLYLFLSTYTYISLFLCMHISTYTYVSLLLCMFISTYTYVSLFQCMFISTYTYFSFFLCMYISTCTYLSLLPSLYVHFYLYLSFYISSFIVCVCQFYYAKNILSMRPAFLSFSLSVISLSQFESWHHLSNSLTGCCCCCRLFFSFRRNDANNKHRLINLTAKIWATFDKNLRKSDTASYSSWNNVFLLLLLFLATSE